MGNRIHESQRDPITGYPVFVSSDHTYIHQGNGFSLIAVTTALAAAGTYKVGFTTPNIEPQKYIHWRPAQFSSSGNAVRHRLYEGSVYSAGTPVQPINRNRNRTSQISNMVFYRGATAALTGNLTITTKAGTAFANQPGGSKVTAVSDNDVEDKLISLTVYGTKTGATATVTSETIALNGTTAVDTVLATWQNILALELSAASTGTITVKNGAAATIITIAAGTLSKGIETPTITNAREQIVDIVAGGGATTMPVGIIGTAADGSVLTSVIALNGATVVPMNSSIFNTLTKVLIGAVESTRTVSVTIPEKIISSSTVGSGGTSSRSGGVGGGSDLEIVLQPNTSYVAYFENIGVATATDIDVDFFFYEEEGF